MHLPTLQLRPQVRLRRQLRMQLARSQLKPLKGDQVSVRSLPRSGRNAEGHIMRKTILLGGTILLALSASVGTPPGSAAQTAITAEPSGLTLIVPRPKAGRSRPLVAVVADIDGAQTTDFIVPYGILKDSGVADVRSVSTAAGVIAMTRGLRIVTDETVAEFDAREAAGADIVIVPAQAKPKSPALSKWLRAQAAKGATIVSVCEGARVLASAGLLDGRRAVTHWAALKSMAKSYPTTTWVRDLRYVQDGTVITTAGVTASIPMSLALVEAIGGRPAAEATARRFGVENWGAAHRTADFAIESADRAAAADAQRAKKELTEIPISDGVDEVSLALQAEAWGRTMRTKVVTTHVGRTPVRSRNGLIIVADAESKPGSHVVEAGTLPAMPGLEVTLAEMGRRYGSGVIRFAILGMEYDPRGKDN